MNIDELRQSLGGDEPPGSIPPLVEAMWWEAHGDWQRAHEIAQDVETCDGSWVHAYLHRQEGDLGNAAYWYRRAGRPVYTGSPDDEWEAIVRELMSGV